MRGSLKLRAVARKFLAATGFTQGFFNMEFFFDAARDRLAVIEFRGREILVGATKQGLVRLAEGEAPVELNP